MSEINIIYGSFKEVSKDIKDESVKLIFTDPPYPKAYISCYEDLANLSPRIMSDHASLLTIIPHLNLPYITSLFEGKLKYRWILCMDQHGGPNAIMPFGIYVKWKPILWYVKNSFNRGGSIKDMFRPFFSKTYHKWEQPLSWCLDLIKYLTDEGDLVCDPFLGSGTVALACEYLNRRFIGCDIDKNSIKNAEKRLKNFRNSIWI